MQAILNAILTRLATMPQARYAVLVLCSFAFAYFFLVGDAEKLKKRQQRIKAQIQEEEVIARETERLLRDKETVSEAVEKLGAQFQDSLKKLPTELNVAELIRGINNTAKAANARIRTIRPGRVVNEEFYESLPIQIEADGSFAQLTLFLSYIARMPRIVRIEGFEIREPLRREGTRAGNLELQASLKGYRYLSEEERPKEDEKRNNRRRRR